MVVMVALVALGSAVMVTLPIWLCTCSCVNEVICSVCWLCFALSMLVCCEFCFIDFTNGRGGGFFFLAGKGMGLWLSSKGCRLPGRCPCIPREPTRQDRVHTGYYTRC